MPIGKDSIKTRVAKVAAEAPAETAQAEAPAEVKPAAKKPATKKPAAPKAPKAEGETPAKKPATKKAPAKKPAAPKAETPVAEAPAVDTAVLANVAPETVAAVIGHDEKKPSEKVQIGQKMPSYLL